MSLAFLILAHKNPRQVERLFRAIHRPEDVVVLHFDRRAPAALHELGRQLARAHRNVHLLRPQTILWGGYRMAAVQIQAMAAALRADGRWHHFINLTGQDFPIKPVAALDAHLAANPESNYVSWFDPVFTPLWSNARDRMRFYYLEWPWLERVLRIPGAGRRIRRLLGWQNRLPHLPRYTRRWPDFRYYGGANHVILSRAGAAYLAHDPEAQRITRWLSHAAHANEIVFQTVLLNSPLAATIVNGHLREIDFPPNRPHPRTFREADLDRLRQSPAYFARKFDDTVDSAILDRLAEHLGLPPTVHEVVAHS
ncbi:MAG TPA: beta-1,6-N-acetylglucosaminyltransferase [Opitutus sp.]|nr:beta-1,6-N-acetylglucosaminyltransferase [Opitutus sp.]